MLILGNALVAAALIGAVGNNIKSQEPKQKDVQQKVVKNPQNVKKGVITNKILVKNKKV